MNQNILKIHLIDIATNKKKYIFIHYFDKLNIIYKGIIAYKNYILYRKFNLKIINKLLTFIKYR